MKKTVFCLLGLAAVVLTIAVHDYQTNHRIASATLYTVEPSAYQEKLTFDSPIRKQGNFYLMSGAVRKIDSVKMGAPSRISLREKTYQGYLWRLDPAFDGIYYATVAVTGCNHSSEESATAVIFGEFRQDFIAIPKECIIIDETGHDAVFVVAYGYAMLRQVEPGEVLPGGMRQICHGIFPNETLIISPKNIRTGDLIFQDMS